MAYSTKDTSTVGVRRGSKGKSDHGLASKTWVRGEIRNRLSQQSPAENRFYELELAEVVDVYKTEEQLPDIEETGEKNWGFLGSILARKIINAARI